MEIEDIIERVSIYDYISQFTELEERSDGEFWGLSPLKDENTPSFSVNVEKQRFYDFSTGFGGNVLDFACKYHDCGCGRAIRLLKDFAGIDEDTELSAPVRLEASSIAKRFKENARQVKQSKSSVLPSDYMDRYSGDKSKLQPWIDEGISLASMERFQVRYDPVSDRIVFPIRNVSGDIINVSGRTLDQEYKSKGLRKYTYFKPLGVLDTIYGLSENMDEIMKKREIILFEGAKSVMLADGWGVKNTGAILTSHLNRNQFLLLIRLGVNVVFALDAEVDIRQDANIMKLLPYTRVEWLRNRDGLLQDKDAPVDRGEKVFKELYDKRRRIRELHSVSRPLRLQSSR